ncbi:hypothetical protein ARMGADRAFT_543618 [Armillaria gallica]|uniref:Uncharacterized protein n=1 Tax=Armillaria gallica TaxID=47427 RepID=A0A2H3CSA0_ARMGA|nr:hypothetical protein ARMGADRAFT_543618 [Armillaria gallica]
MDNLRSLALALAFPSFELHPTPLLYFWTTPSQIRTTGQAETELLTWLDGQTNVVSLRFPFLVDDDASRPTAFPATPRRTRVLSAPTIPSQSFLFPMPPLSPLPPTPTPTKDTFMNAAATTLQGSPRLIISSHRLDL